MSTMLNERPPERSAHSQHSQRRLAAASLAALGVVFGDLGTSPLYALHDTFVGSHPVAVTPENVLGILSLFVWSLIIVVSGKYLALAMRASRGNNGGSRRSLCSWVLPGLRSCMEMA